jgi:hypothetical protein
MRATDDDANTDDCGRDDARLHHFGRFLDALGGQQRRGDGCPFRRKISGCRRAACLPIPITGIVEIALNAVQVSLRPVGDNLVCSVPIIFARPPQRHQRRHKPVWRLWSCETMLEVRWAHDRHLDVQTRLPVDRSRTCRAHHLVLRPGSARAADGANKLSVLDQRNASARGDHIV